MTINEYITITNRRYQTGISREHSYRGDLQELLQSLLPDVLVTNEPARIGCGSPDYILTRKDVPVGYIEAKDLSAELGSKLYKEQFDRYKAALDNLIITDYLQFHFYKQGVLVDSISIGEISHGKVHAIAENFERFTALIENFAMRVTQSIKSPTKLAQMMAAKAKLMAQVIESALNSDDEVAANTSIKEQMVAFKNILIHDIDNGAFADIYAQTIAYGMFAARYHDPTLPTFSREEAATLIPKSNPFLRKLFQYLAGYDLDQRLAWIVDELVQIFLATDVAAIMRNFGKSTRQNDPIIHFYETFLAEYDPKLRKARGVWYTPEPVVNFIVRAVDELLKTKFNLPQGLADTSKTKVMLDIIEPGSKGKSVKKEKELHRVQILDPATGTGTFLAQVVRHIHGSQFASMQGAWPQYVKEHLIPRLNGFELLMTSYAMAHLKLDMLLTETGYKSTDDSERLRIYLTNSLEEHHPDTGTLFASWLSSEANEANHIKRDAPVMVVVGNPPYSVSSSNKSEWIQKLLADYKKDLNERNIQPLSDDYIKFIRFGQHYIDKNGEGILAYISNNSFIDGIIHRQMRKSLLESFDEIYILDLHGNAKKQETAPDGSKDENVFDIMQGVSINLFIKTGNKAKDSLANVFAHHLYGKREAKYAALHDGSLANLPWQTLVARAPEYYFIPKNFEVESQYRQGFSVNELFTLTSSGIKTHRDHFVIDVDKNALANRIQRFFNSTVADESIRGEMELKDNRDWALAKARKNGTFDQGKLQTITYRPFDNRPIYYDAELIDFGRENVMNHIINGSPAFICFRQSRNNEKGTFWVSNNIVGKDAISSLDTCSVFPLYLYPDHQNTDLLSSDSRTPNLDPAMAQKISSGLGLTFTTEKTTKPLIPAQAGIQTGLNTTDVSNSAETDTCLDSRLRGNDDKYLSPIDLLDYIYATLHSPSYRETYKEFLKIDFPRVPYPTDATQFWQLVALGSQLRKTHLLETPVPIDSQAGAISYPVSDNHLVVKPRFELHGEIGRVYINETQYFEGVSALAWTFYIGGYQPAQKWLKDRKGRALNFEDILHYQKIIHALSETDRLMHEIDGILTH